jgi:hypothetical protein
MNRHAVCGEKLMRKPSQHTASAVDMSVRGSGTARGTLPCSRSFSYSAVATWRWASASCMVTPRRSFNTLAMIIAAQCAIEPESPTGKQQDVH